LHKATEMLQDSDFQELQLRKADRDAARSAELLVKRIQGERNYLEWLVWNRRSYEDSISSFEEATRTFEEYE